MTGACVTPEDRYAAADRRRASAIRVTDDRCLIKPDITIEGLSSGGIVLPATARQERVTRGTVLAVGPGRRARVLMGVARDGEVIYQLSDRRIPMGVRVGDRVLVVEGRALVTQHKGEEVWIVAEPNVYAVEEP